VFVILMENTTKSTLDSASNTPWLKAAAKSYATGSDYHGVAHPSLPNYLALTSGSDQGVGCDCEPVGSACAFCASFAFPTGCGCKQTATHLGDQLDTAGKTWKAYAESMGTPCNPTGAGSWAPKHMPFLYYDNMGAETGSARCQSHVVTFDGFAADLESPPAFAFIAPNLDDDMHGTGAGQTSTDVGNGDTWLSKNAQPILDSAAFKAGGLLVIVWDEDDGSGGLTKTDDPIQILVMSPYAKKGGYVSAGKANHYSLLATIEDAFGLPRLGNAASAVPLADYFPAN
jgi:acid phosphatase